MFRAARAQVVPAQLLAQLFVAVDDAEATPDLRLGGEALPTLAGGLEKTVRLRGCAVGLPYGLQGCAGLRVGGFSLVERVARSAARLKLGWPAGLAPALPPSQGGMLLLQHDQQANAERGSRSAEKRSSPFRVLRSAFRVEVVLSRGLAPRTSAFAGRCAELLHLESGKNLRITRYVLRGKPGAHDSSCVKRNS